METIKLSIKELEELIIKGECTSGNKKIVCTSEDFPYGVSPVKGMYKTLAKLTKIQSSIHDIHT